MEPLLPCELSDRYYPKNIKLRHPGHWRRWYGCLKTLAFGEDVWHLYNPDRHDDDASAVVKPEFPPPPPDMSEEESMNWRNHVLWFQCRYMLWDRESQAICRINNWILDTVYHPPYERLWNREKPYETIQYLRDRFGHREQTRRPVEIAK